MAQRTRGFTLVEVLVALFIMAVLAGLAWKGVDALVRTRDGSKAAAEAVLRQGTVLAQWEQDLGQIQDTAVVPALAFDGGALRLTRRVANGLQFVVWTRQGNQLWRWASPAITHVNELNEAYTRGQQWASISGEALAMLDGVSELQVYYYRGNDNAWSNAQSTGDTANTAQSETAKAAPPGTTPGTSPGANTPNTGGVATGPVTVVPDLAAEALPKGVRLLLTLPAGQLTRDLMLRP
jgi:general secretion pathway protein J